MKQINVPFWVTVARATLAAALGLALIFQPDKARPVLVNFMGMFWLVSGIMSLRWGATGQSSRQFFPMLAGFVGIVAGLLVISRNIVGNLLSLEAILNLLGAVMVLTSVVHIGGGFQIGRQARHRTWASVILGANNMGPGGWLSAFYRSAGHTKKNARTRC